MRFELPVVWALQEATFVGRLDVVDDRLTLTSKRETFSFDLKAVAALMIDRAPARRLRGLPALSLRLTDGVAVRVASMGGVGSLQELAKLVGGRQPAATGT